MIQQLLRSLVLPALVAMIGGSAVSAEEELPPLPALTEPASGVHLPGKFVWADLFTSEFDAARRFYAETFGWEWRWVSRSPAHRYGIFYDAGRAVAGVAHRVASEADEPYARWIHYVSVADVSGASEAVVARGGRMLLGRRSFPDRGEFAIVADVEGAPFGLLRSSSGDPPDHRAEIGEWLWIGLASRDARAAAGFYASLFGYEIYDLEDSDTFEVVLAAGGYARAGIGQLSEGSESKPTWLGLVRVDDVGAALGRARSAGGVVLYEAGGGDPVGRLAIVGDPYGAVVGLIEWTFGDSEPGTGEEAQ